MNYEIRDTILKNGFFKFKINSKNSIILDKFISRGAEAYVFNISEIYSEKKIDSNLKLIAKIINRNSKYELNKLQEIFLSIKHENIERLFYLRKFKVSYLLVCEKLDYILGNFKMLDLYNTFYVASEIIEALLYLHIICSIAHCDIKENNIMFCKSTKRFKLIDFNNAQHKSDFKKFELKVTLFRISVNLLANEFDWDYSVDLWALGSTLYKCFYGREILEEYNGYASIKNHLDLTKNEKKQIIEYYVEKIKQLELGKINKFFYFFYSTNDCNTLKNSVLDYKRTII
jgi:serine/threonine protein kinase